MTWGFLAALASFLVFLILQMVIFHLFRIRRRVAVILASALLLSPSVILWQDWIGPQPSPFPPLVEACLFAPLIFMFLWFVYLQFYFVVERGVSLRIIQTVAASAQGCDKNSILAVYSFEDVLRRRIRDMENGGYLSSEPNSGAKSYANTPKGERIGRLAAFFKARLGIGSGG